MDRTFQGKMGATVREASHRYYTWSVNGKVVLSTMLSTPTRGDRDKSLVAHIASRQLKLPGGAAALKRLCDCTMTAEEWQAHVAVQPT